MAKESMHERHHAQKRALNTKQEAEMKDMMARHDQEMGAQGAAAPAGGMGAEAPPAAGPTGGAA